MAIRNEAGEKCTPKDKAKEIVVDSINMNIEKWIDDHPEDIGQMTDRELALVTTSCRSKCGASTSSWASRKSNTKTAR